MRGEEMRSKMAVSGPRASMRSFPRGLGAAVTALGMAGMLTAVVASAEEPRDRYREPVMDGPFRIEITRVIEGFRFDVRFRTGPAGRGATRFRLSNVHTPAIHTDQECERELGNEARDFVRRFIRGRNLRARDVRRGRDTRSWVGRIEANGEDLSEALLAANLAVPYNDSWRNPERRHWECGTAPMD